MDQPAEFRDVVTKYVHRSCYTPGQISNLSGLAKATIVNSLEGRVKKLREWRNLLKIAHVLELCRTSRSRR